MKKILFLILICHAAAAQIKNNEPVQNLSFNLVNAPMQSASLNDFKGKVVVIEFWATWCGSCIVAMPHLKELQDKFPDKLRIISVSNEKTARIQKFLKARPSTVWFASDTSNIISDVFPHRLIPHTVVISPNGTLVSNTSPEQVTAEVIEKLLHNETVTLEEKSDNTLTYQQLIDINFKADNNVTDRFMIQPKIEGAPGFSTTYLDNEVFKGKRITGINLDISSLYRLAYGDFPYNRTVDKIPKADRKSYCIDLIVKEPAQLLPQFKKELAAIFDIKPSIKSETKDVYVLKVADPKKLKTLPLNTSGKRTYYARHGEVDQESMTLADLADYLESYGIVNIPVIDETNNSSKYDIKFSFQPEDKSSLIAVLAERGLVLEKAKRNIDILYLNQ